MALSGLALFAWLQRAEALTQRAIVNDRLAVWKGEETGLSTAWCEDLLSELPARDETASLVYEPCITSGARIGPLSVLGRHCSVGDGSSVERAVLHDNVLVGHSPAESAAPIQARRESSGVMSTPRLTRRWWRLGRAWRPASRSRDRGRPRLPAPDR